MGSVAAPLANSQFTDYYNGLLALGLTAVGAPVVRDGANGKLAMALFDDALFVLGMWNQKFFINVILFRDTISKTSLATLTQTTFGLVNVNIREDDLGSF